jgi:SRSO17 transposase
MDINEETLKIIADELVDFHQLFRECFKCTQNMAMGLTYLSGLLSNCSEKSIEPIALEFLGEGSVRNLQRFMKSYQWDHQKMEEKNMETLAPLIALPTGMINTDASDFAKKGKESVGVARQYCGSMGKVENCQSGVFVGYASEKGYVLLKGQLYMPEKWFSEEQKERREFNLVPENLTFKTKNQIALELIQKVIKTGLFPAKWIGCDAAFGSDWEFLSKLPKEINYFASIKSNTRIFLEKPISVVPEYSGLGRKPKNIKNSDGQPAAILVSSIANSPDTKWETAFLAEGAKGPVYAEVCRIKVYPVRDGLAKTDQVWLFIRKLSNGDIKYAFSNAPAAITLKELCEASTMRWPIEQCFQEGKSYLGMDQYEHRSWPAWHRHMLYVFLAQHFLLKLRITLKKKSQR